MKLQQCIELLQEIQSARLVYNAPIPCQLGTINGIKRLQEVAITLLPYLIRMNQMKAFL